MNEKKMLLEALRVLSHNHPLGSPEAVLARSVLTFFHPDYFVKNLNAQLLNPNAEPTNDPWPFKEPTL